MRPGARDLTARITRHSAFPSLALVSHGNATPSLANADMPDGQLKWIFGFPDQMCTVHISTLHIMTYAILVFKFILYLMDSFRIKVISHTLMSMFTAT